MKYLVRGLNNFDQTRLIVDILNRGGESDCQVQSCADGESWECITQKPVAQEIQTELREIGITLV